MAGQESENFTSRWTMLLSMIGVAVGTGNIWRFPRIAAKYGGGSFLILWKGTVGAFARLVGPHYAWMGACVGFVTTAIMFYYSVVNGWCLWYLLAALTGNLQGLGVAEAQTLWSNVIHGAQPVLFHLLSMGIGTVILSRNVVRGIERANRLFVPSLVVLMAVLLLRAVTLPGALKGIESFLTVRWEMFFDYRPWLDALSQNAWSMSASWGLILTYVVYLRKREDTVLNPVITAFANHSISLVAGIMIFATVYALIPLRAAEVISQPGPLNTGLAFIWIPQLLSRLPGGTLFSIIFFLALSFAFMSSLISMIALAVRVLSDAGLTTWKTTLLVGVLGFLMGISYALSPTFFLNQDWVWGIGLIVSGAFFAFAVLRFDVACFRKNYINVEGSDVRVGKGYDLVVRTCIPVEVVVLIGRWFWVAIQAGPGGVVDSFAGRIGGDLSPPVGNGSCPLCVP